ncbi:hypothetical protein BVG16_12045 [Paenibacillus selenitireducens]|uniref:Uncharacterized protein n=1 Tax=Paenibacillus selenitireducens TaxID=1324314 RepID=A0A1T2XFC4_9BACL|nr:hypothetical protein [Paenibacillus selenitireducens]OPA78589.1 hypothetical protein BVG16_12045 [Paenibacillus selenitireducens]
MKALWLILSSLLCGVLIGMYSLIPSPANLIFSLGALILSIYFFRKFERLSSRIWYVVLSIVFYLLFIVILTMIQFIKANPIPA